MLIEDLHGSLHVHARPRPLSSPAGIWPTATVTAANAAAAAVRTAAAGCCGRHACFCRWLSMICAAAIIVGEG